MSRPSHWFVAAALVLPPPPLLAQTMRRVSVAAGGVEADSGSTMQDRSLTRDGRALVFETYATNLIPGGVNNLPDIVVVDLISGSLELIDVDSNGVQANYRAQAPAITPDGRYVVFHSKATNLVANDVNGVEDVFLRDRLLGTTTLVSMSSTGTQGDGSSLYPSISDSGRYVTFNSYARNLVPGDFNNMWDVFVFDVALGAIHRVSIPAGGGWADNRSYGQRISSHGRWIVFTSDAGNLVPGDTNLATDVFLRDRWNQTTQRISVGPGGVESDQDSYVCGLTPDAHWCVFISLGTTLVSGDTNGLEDIFVCDTTTGVVTRVDVDAQGNEADGRAQAAAISDDGRFVAFSSLATNLLGSGNTLSGTHLQLFLHDRDADGNGVFDEAGGIDTRLLSVDAATGGEADGETGGIALTRDGLRVAFDSGADDLIASDTNGVPDVFLVNHGAAARVAYGSGWAGSLGTPALTASADPILGTSISVDATNSLGAATVGLLILGGYPIDEPTGLGGSLLAAPEFLVPMSIPVTGSSQLGTLPVDPVWSGIELFLQVLEVDAGASHGVSFTPGLELILG